VNTVKAPEAVPGAFFFGVVLRNNLEDYL